MRSKIILVSCVMLVVMVRTTFSQLPSYEMRAMSFYKPAQNSLSFEIRMIHTNYPVVYEFAGGQYFFDFNPLIANGGTLTYKYDGDTSELPLAFRPRNPTISGNQLRLAVNTFPGAGNGYTNMSTTYPGTLIVRMRLTTTAASLANVPLMLRWRVYTIANPNPKIFAYLGTVITEITNPDWNLIDSTLIILSEITVKAGIEGLLNNGSHMKADSVSIEIRDAVAPYPIVYSQNVLVDSASLTATVVSNLVTRSYYIVIKHRNGLETWSKPGGELLGNGMYFYDFTSSQSQAYGNNLVFKNGLYCIFSGNLNGDDVIDADDMLIMDNAVLSYAGGNSIANLNGDEIVDIEDLAICDNNARELRVVQRPGMGVRNPKNLYSTP